GASAGCSTSRISPAPHSASRRSPSASARSVSQTASAGPPARRAASASTSAITFLGWPARSSSTTHQNAFGMSDRLGLFAERPHELVGGRLHVTADDAPGRTRGQRLEPHDRELRRLRRHAEVIPPQILDLLLLGPHDPLERRVPR